MAGFSKSGIKAYQLYVRPCALEGLRFYNVNIGALVL
jgi:hypothetical protein